METDIFKHIIIIIDEVMSVKMTKQHIFIIENNLQKVGQSFFHPLDNRDTRSTCATSAGFDINFLTNLSIRASAILILLARNCKLLARIFKCHTCM